MLIPKQRIFRWKGWPKHHPVIHLSTWSGENAGATGRGYGSWQPAWVNGEKFCRTSRLATSLAAGGVRFSGPISLADETLFPWWSLSTLWTLSSVAFHVSVFDLKLVCLIHRGAFFLLTTYFQVLYGRPWVGLHPWSATNWKPLRVRPSCGYDPKEKLWPPVVRTGEVPHFYPFLQWIIFHFNIPTRHRVQKHRKIVKLLSIIILWWTSSHHLPPSVSPDKGSVQFPLQFLGWFRRLWDVRMVFTAVAGVTTRARHCLDFDFEYSVKFEAKLTPFEARRSSANSTATENSFFAWKKRGIPKASNLSIFPLVFSLRWS